MVVAGDAETVGGGEGVDRELEIGAAAREVIAREVDGLPLGLPLVVADHQGARRRDIDPIDLAADPQPAAVFELELVGLGARSDAEGPLDQVRREAARGATGVVLIQRPVQPAADVDGRLLPQGRTSGQALVDGDRELLVDQLIEVGVVGVGPWVTRAADRDRGALPANVPGSCA